MMDVDGADAEKMVNTTGQGNDMSTSPDQKELEEGETSESLSVINKPEDSVTGEVDEGAKKADVEMVDVDGVVLNQSNQNRYSSNGRSMVMLDNSRFFIK